MGTTISNLPVASTTADADLLAIVQSGTTSKLTMAAHRAYLQANFVPANVLQGEVSLTTYGAIGDGNSAHAAVNNAAMIAAIAALPNGGIIRIPPGSYIYSSTWVIPDTVPYTICGSGIGGDGRNNGTELHYTGAASGISMGANGNAHSSWSSFENFRLIGGAGSAWQNAANIGTFGNVDGIQILNTHHGKIDRVLVAGFDGSGIYIGSNPSHTSGLTFNGSYWWHVTNCYCSSCGTGIEGQQANVSYFSNCRCDFNHFGFKNIQIGSSLTAESNTQYGFYFADNQSSVFRYSLYGTWCEGNGTTAGNGGVHTGDIFVGGIGQLAMSGMTILSAPMETGRHNFYCSFYSTVTLEGSYVEGSGGVNVAWNDKIFLEYGSAFYEQGTGWGDVNAANTPLSFVGKVVSNTGNPGYPVCYYHEGPLADPTTELGLGTTQDVGIITPGYHSFTTQLPGSGSTVITNLNAPTGFGIPNGYQINIRVTTANTSFAFTGGNLTGNGSNTYIANIGDILHFTYNGNWALFSITKAAKDSGEINALDFGLILGTDLSNAATNTAALNKAIAALPNGGVIQLPLGVIAFTSLIIPSEIPLIIKGRGTRELAGYGSATGTELRSTIADGATPAITIAAGHSINTTHNCGVTNNSATVTITNTTGITVGSAIRIVKGAITLYTHVATVSTNTNITILDTWLGTTGSTATIDVITDDAAVVQIRDLYLRCSGDPAAASGRGNQHGIFIFHKMHGNISNVYVAGFDSHAIHIDNGYWWNCTDTYASGNGVGFFGLSANTSVLFNCRADFNLTGVTGIQRCVSLSCESNINYGYTCDGSGLDYSLHDIWFENNGTGGSGGDISVTNFALLSISGHTRLSGKITGSYNISAANFGSIIINGVLRLFTSANAIMANLNTNSSLIENCTGNSFLGFVNTTNGATYQVSSTTTQTEVDGGTTLGAVIVPAGYQFVAINTLPVGGFQSVANIVLSTSGNIPLGFPITVRIGTLATTIKFDGSGNIRGNSATNYTCNSTGTVLNGGDILRFYWSFPYWYLTSITKFG